MNLITREKKTFAPLLAADSLLFSELERKLSKNGKQVKRPFRYSVTMDKNGRRCAHRIPNHINNLQDYFWAMVVKCQSGCWEWIGYRHNHGYGHIGVGQGKIFAHRLAAYYIIGDWPTLAVLHRCDNPPCVNPNHLFLGTKTDNYEDMCAKGRAKTALPGEQHPYRKLTRENVRAIRSSSSSSKTLAEDFKIKEGTIRDIRSYRSWRSVC
jgi:hypothetical protein